MMPPLTDGQIYTAMKQGGFPTTVAIVATAIALRESAGVPDVVNDNPATGDYSIGLLQINWKVPEIAAAMTKAGITQEMLKDPVTNARAGVLLWHKNNTNLNILWYINRPGSYQTRYWANLPRAVAAALETPIVIS